MSLALRLAAAGLAAPLLILMGCGMEAAPQPPTLKLPQPVTDLAGVRAGDEVRLHWTMPKRDTDKVLLKGDQKVRICRRVDNGGCEVAVDMLAAPGAASSAVDHLPAALTSGQPRLLMYTVLLENHAGHDAGPSNQVYAASGAAPGGIESFSAEASADGVVLHWRAEAGTELIRIHRTLVVDPKAPKTQQKAGSPAPQEQTLEVTGPDRGQALDRDAVLDNVYRYSVERVRMIALQGQSVEETGAPSELITINARDVFPPQVPSDVQAVADPEAHAVDLSWTPNTEEDLAGYAVYRREAGSNANPVRVSPPGVVSPSFRDASALPGHKYDYSVSAVDRDGNESARSADVEEELPQQ
jgi:hypothetical protein